MPWDNKIKTGNEASPLFNLFDPETRRIVAARVQAEQDGKKIWKERWGQGTDWDLIYRDWINSGISRAMRKPSLRSVEWLKYHIKPDCPHDMSNCDEEGGRLTGTCQSPEEGEIETRRGIVSNQPYSEYNPKSNYKCKPGPYPRTTSQEVGWLSEVPSCQLETFANSRYMQKPPLPWKVTSWINMQRRV